MCKMYGIIEELCSAQGIKPGKLCSDVGISRGVLSDLKAGRTKKLSMDTAEKIAKYFGVSTDYLNGQKKSPTNGEREWPDNMYPLPPMKEWRVLGGTACGEPIYKDLDGETVLAPADIDADCVFRCVGDSMINARIFDGDLVFMKTGVPVEDGQIAVVRVEDSYSLKRIYYGPDYLELRSENPMYKPIIVRGEQENAEIVGRAVKFLSNVL